MSLLRRPRTLPSLANSSFQRLLPCPTTARKKANNGMSEAGNAVRNPPDAAANAPAGGQNRVTELKVSGHLMTLDTGLFCVFQVPGSTAPNDRSGLPGVRISMPPGAAGRADAVSISTFRDDGWLDGHDAAALVRVAKGPAQVLVTVYQAPAAPPESAPRLQVMRLGPEQGGGGQAPAPVPGARGRQTVGSGERRCRGAHSAHRRCGRHDRRMDRHARQRPVDRRLQPGAA